MRLRQWLILFSLVCLGLAALAGCAPKARISSSSVDLTGLGYGEDFRLNDADGKVRTMQDFKGQVVMIFFGFTQCPDVCPTALLRAAEVRRKLGKDGARLQVLFVTIDPERDTPAVLKSYTTAFDPGFIGLSTDLAATRKIADAFKVFYQKVPTGNSYTMDHSAISYLLDPAGKMRIAVRPTASPDDVVNDIRFILNEQT